MIKKGKKTSVIKDSRAEEAKKKLTKGTFNVSKRKTWFSSAMDNLEKENK